MTGRVELARQQWEHAHRTLVTAGGPLGIDEAVQEQIDVVRRELRRRLGGPFTLAELTDAYEGSARWGYEAIAERCGRPGWARTASVATDAAFHLYAQGAQDFQP